MKLWEMNSEVIGRILYQYGKTFFDRTLSFVGLTFSKSGLLRENLVNNTLTWILILFLYARDLRQTAQVKK